MQTSLPDVRRLWRIEELQDLPDDGCKYELVDGRLDVTPPVTQFHQLAGQQLMRVLLDAMPPGWLALPEFPLRLSEDTQRQPDIALFRSPPQAPTGDARNPVGPADIGLLLEVVSPSSRRRDRFHKPGEYADAGIPIYWRLETEPDLALHTFVLEGSTYVPDTIIAGRGSAAVPWGRVEVDLATLGFP